MTMAVNEPNGGDTPRLKGIAVKVDYNILMGAMN